MMAISLAARGFRSPSDFPKREGVDYLRNKGKLNEGTVVEVVKFLTDLRVTYRRSRIIGVFIHLSNWIVMLLLTGGMTLAFSVFYNAELGYYNLGIYISFPSIFACMVIWPVTLIYMSRDEGNILSVDLGRLPSSGYSNRSIEAKDFMPFVNKFCRGPLGRCYAFMLKILTLGFVGGVMSSWKVEYGILVSAIDMCQNDPQTFQEIVRVAKNKKEFRQMMAVR